MLPVQDNQNIVSLGEGMTPIIILRNLAKENGLKDLRLKDEGLNPTCSFKARGLSVAISKARELGVISCIMPTAGNAGGAMSAYCASAGIQAIVVMPEHTPSIFIQECERYGSKVVLVDGLIDRCGEKVNSIKEEINAFDISTLKEPYRLEGKKTMGYEIAEQMNWKLPDIILCPTGGGTGLIGIWKAFREIKEIGLLKENKFPKMIAVQAANCSPVVDTFNGLLPDPSKYTYSIASGLAVPKPFGLDLTMEVLKESNGLAVSVDENEIRDGMVEISRKEGVLVSPEGAAAWKALIQLLDIGFIKDDENILILNTGSGYKYFEEMS